AQVLQRLRQQGVELPAQAPPAPARSPSGAALKGVWPDVATAVTQAWEAHRQLQEMSLDQRKKVIAGMRRAAHAANEELSRIAVEETGLGRVDDKLRKNALVTDKTPGVEILDPCIASGDRGLALEELAPWGVIGAITPSTNPSETIICNGIGMVAGGNAGVFGPHPAAQKVSHAAVDALNRGAAEAGGPETILNSFLEPTIEKAQELMRHPRIPLLVVTGGPGVVQEAMRHGKRVIAAGPGNPPAVVDETADVERAAADVLAGASLDNNIVCSDEKEAIVVGSVMDRFKQVMEREGAYEIHGHQIRRLEEIVLERPVPGPEVSKIRTEWVGKDAAKYLEALGVTPSKPPRLVICEVDADHPFVWTELLMPILPVVRVRDVEAAMDLAVRAERGLRHTATFHSRNIESLSTLARRINTSIFVKNGPAFAGLGLGGEGYTSFTIAGPTGEGLTMARHFCRFRRCTLVDAFRIV
ncbi:MAG: aldehyde dehydrogenase family protein, partial [Candidatus Eisenbacteria bacterium]|nr:aldehyde dehydrogenase family protein [Candidatus Eisenbacteria bacterium]